MGLKMIMVPGSENNFLNGASWRTKGSFRMKMVPGSNKRQTQK